MARLIGAQRMVLQAILDLPAESADFVTDGQIAQKTQIAIADVRDWIETLEGEAYVEVARRADGLSASITAQGKLVLRQFQPFGPTATASQASRASSLMENPPGTPPPPASDGSNDAGRTTSPSAKATAKAPVEVFFSYSHKDKDLRDDLGEHLSLLKRKGIISGWHDRQILPGGDWAGEIDKHLESAQVVLLLVSPSFLASDYCYDIETKRALERHDKGEAVVIPVLVRPCDWKSGPFAKLAALPANWTAVTSWSNRDEAWTDVALGIRRAVEACEHRSPAIRHPQNEAPSVLVEGGEKMVLKAVMELQGESLNYVEDRRLAVATGMAVDVVRKWLADLDVKGLAVRRRENVGFSAYITVGGRQALGMSGARRDGLTF